MKKLVTLMLVFVMILSMMISCGDTKDPSETDGIGTGTSDDSADNTTDEKDDATETEKETEEETETELVLPVQTDVPCNFDDVLDLSDDILVTEYMLEDGKGVWILGDDTTAMSNIITEDLLNEYEYFAIKYETDYCDECSTIALMFKLTHEDGTKTEFLCNEWFAWGPAGMTYQASSFAVMNVYADSVFYVPTEQFLTNENFLAGDIIDQIGLCAVEESGTYVYLTITGAYLTK